MTATATEPRKNSNVGASLPFAIASRAMTRFSFTDTRALSAGITPVTPIQVPAVGYLRRLRLKFTVQATAGTAFPGDGPFNLIQSIEFRTAAGNDLIVPMTGYQIMLMNKYAHPAIMSPWSDPRYVSYSTTAGTAATFYLDLNFELDAETGLGSIPALASNRAYQLIVNYGPYSLITAATAATITMDGVAHYWSEPPAQSASGIAQDTQPQGLGTIAQWQLDTPPITPGSSSRRNSCLSMFPCSRWLIPDVAVVKHSTTWTRCEASAGGTPSTPTINALEITPKAMPSAPSTSCAAKPTAMNGQSEARSKEPKSIARRCRGARA